MRSAKFSPRQSRHCWIVALAAWAGLALGGPPPALAADYKESLARMLEGHKRLAAAQADLRAGQAALGKARAAWAPELTARGTIGRSRAHTDPIDETLSLTPREITLSLNQLVWDFGKTGAEIDQAALQQQRGFLNVETTRQDLLLEGLIADINLYRARSTLDFAQRSVENIRRQTGQEESMVALGSGLPTDVLQARSQLAGAQAREVLARGALDIAVNRYVALFYEEPPDLASLQPIPVPLDSLPVTLDEAIEVALDRNLLLRSLRLETQIAKAELRRVVGDELAPELTVTAEAKFKEDSDNIPRRRQEQIVKFEIGFPFNLGLASFRSREVAREAIAGAGFRLDDAQDSLLEQVRNSWQGLLTARDNAEFLRNQAHITGEFLELARQERLLGTRSLIDVLAGETALINAESDAASAEADVGIAAFTLLRTIGVLNLDMLP